MSDSVLTRLTHFLDTVSSTCTYKCICIIFILFFQPLYYILFYHFIILFVFCQMPHWSDSEWGQKHNEYLNVSLKFLKKYLHCLKLNLNFYFSFLSFSEFSRMLYIRHIWDLHMHKQLNNEYDIWLGLILHVHSSFQSYLLLSHFFLQLHLYFTFLLFPTLR